MHNCSLVSQAESAMYWPDHFKVFKNDSDNMEPFIKKGSYVVIDTLYQDIVEAVYALKYGHHIVIKRLQMLPSGRLLVKCDNPLYATEEFSIHNLPADMILGRVRFVETRLF